MKTNNELFVCIRKKKILNFLSQKLISLCRFEEHLYVFKYFSFSASDMVSLNHSYLLPLLNLVKWNTDEGINSHVVYGEAAIKLQYFWIKWVLLHWRDIKKALPAATILQHSQISSQCHMTFFPRYSRNGGTYLDLNLQQKIFKFINKGLVLLHVFPDGTKNTTRHYINC